MCINVGTYSAEYAEEDARKRKTPRKPPPAQKKRINGGSFDGRVSIRTADSGGAVLRTKCLGGYHGISR